MDNLAQIFSLLDTDQKDYITESDLRTASNSQNNGNIDDIIKLLNIKNGERLTLHQFCQRIHGIRDYQEDYSSLELVKECVAKIIAYTCRFPFQNIESLCMYNNLLERQ